MIFKNKSFRFCVATAMFALAFCLAAANLVPRPIKGNFTGSGFTFGGNFSHMGNFSGQITSFIPTETGGITTATWTAANGDTVEVTSVFTVTGFDFGTGLFIFHQDITVDGGTGRFQGASGDIDGDGETSIDFSYYFGAINGTIDY